MAMKTIGRPAGILYRLGALITMAAVMAGSAAALGPGPVPASPPEIAAPPVGDDPTPPELPIEIQRMGRAVDGEVSSQPAGLF